MDGVGVWRHRAVIIHRDENGYGLTVFGDNPVSVQTIKPGGAAENAGIREGDVIVKVNGTLVEHMTHTEVVNLIKSAGAYVTLTVRPPGCDLYPPTVVGMPSVGFLGGNGGRPHHHLSTDRVTAPLPANEDVQLQMQGYKLRTLQAMRDKAAGDVEKLWKKYEGTGHPQDMVEFEKAQQGLKKIESQMKSFRQSSPNLQLQLQTPIPFGQSFNSPGGGGIHHHLHHQFQPPPRHNRNPLAGQGQGPPPSGGNGQGHTYQNINWIDSGDGGGSMEPPTTPPPPLPPRSYPHSSSSNNSSPSSSFNSHNNRIQYNNHNNQLQHDNMLVKHHSAEVQGSGGGGTNQNQQTHHRTKSSPDPVSMQKALLNSASQEGCSSAKRSDSLTDLCIPKSNSSKGRSSGGTWGESSPPSSPPPPYPNKNNNVGKLTSGGNQPFSPIDIIAMEEDDPVLWPNEPIVPSISGFHGPYSSLSRLLEHNAHLAVFINYVIDNRRDPSSLLFYLITSFGVEEASLKEMKRWGYEIHSTFTAPGAPLLIPNVDVNIANEIDDALTTEADKEEMMKRVFRKARHKAKEEINKQLEEFCNKRTAGLGSMYGPPDIQLEESLQDKQKELRIVETYLVPRVEQFNAELDKEGDPGRTFAVMIAVATIIVKLFGLRGNANLNNILEKHGSLMSKDKSKSRYWQGKPKKVTYNGHHFVLQCYSSYTECNVCSKILWGIGPQGQHCVDCHLNIHRSSDTFRTYSCLSQIPDQCPGPNQKTDKFSRLKERIRREKDPRKRLSKKGEDGLGGFWGPFGGEADNTGEKGLSGSGSGSNLHKESRRPDTLSEERIAPDGFPFEDDDGDTVHHSEPRKSSTAVGRSESCKERVQRKQTRERRKHSDPNLSKSNDVDLDNQRHLSDANNSGSSSNSSLSARYLTSLESPSTSLELVGASNNSSSSLRGDRSSETPETTTAHPTSTSTSHDPYKPSPGSWDGDSDIEIDQDPPDWTKNVPEETLASMDRLEKKRQEILNELIHTERSHVRNLKVVDRLFHKPIRQQQLLNENLVQMLFANLEEMLEMHGRFNSSLKKLKAMSNPVVEDIGPVLREMFDGESGENFRRAAATFCAKQQIGLELLREKRRKDGRFHTFLTEAESDPVCRRLGIKDMIPMAMQRLTKYPLLFENLCNCTPQETEEYKNLQRAVDLSKEILTHVNAAKKEAEDQERLIEIQRKLDKSIDKGDKNDPSVNEMKNLDFTKHRLIHEGPLLWRMAKGSKQKADLQEVQAVLLHDMIVILWKQDDRYVLKIHNMGFPAKSDRMMAKPIIKLNNLHHRPVATDKRAFFLISTTTSNMYELVCSTAEERNVWFHHITKAADEYKNRQESRRSETLLGSSTSNSLGGSPHNNIASSSSSTPTTISTTNIPIPEEGGKDDVEVDKDPSGLRLPLGPPGGGGVSKEPTPEPVGVNSPTSPDKQGGEGGDDGRLSAGNNKVGRSASTGSTRNKKDVEFLRVTQSSPFIDPSEIVVTSNQVHFAQQVISPYEELKRADAQVRKALEDKLRISSKLFPSNQNIPQQKGGGGDDNIGSSKDPKELIVCCIQQVDRLMRITNSSEKKEQGGAEQQLIHTNLNKWLTHILTAFERKEEELEVRRQELHRLREQNHGYQERLEQAIHHSPQPHPLPPPSSDADNNNSNDNTTTSAAEDPEGGGVMMKKDPLKQPSSDLVASSSSEEDNATLVGSDPDSQPQSCESAHKFADASSSSPNTSGSSVEEGLGGIGIEDSASSSSSEKNRDCPETEEIVVVTTEVCTIINDEDKPASTVPDEKVDKKELSSVNGHTTNNNENEQEINRKKKKGGNAT